MTEHIRTPRSRLFDLEWEETSFVGEGDNPGAHILFTKERDDNEHIVAKAIAEVAKEDEESMTETVLKTSTGRVLRTQSDAVAWMGEEAEKLQKQDPRMGRADALWRVYETHNVVLERSYELPPGELDPVESRAHNAPVFDEDEEEVALSKSVGERGIIEAAHKLMEGDYELTEAEAVRKVYESPRYAGVVNKWRREQMGR